MEEGSETTATKHRVAYLTGILLLLTLIFSCKQEVARTAEAVYSSDSLPFMHSTGINTLISDSGVMRYRMVAEEWDIYTAKGTAPTWKFMKGLLMERFDEDFHIDLYVQSDTAYLHNQRTWELRGRVVVRNVKNEVFKTEELFWDMNEHEMWSHKYMKIITPERELEGTEFRSNEQMTKYSVSNSIGAFPVSDTQTNTPADSAQTDTIKQEHAKPLTPKKPQTKTPVQPQNSNEKMRFAPAPNKRISPNN